MISILTVVGARPQFIKAAVISRLIRGTYSSQATEFLLHTGQHYDDSMSEVFFREMDIPKPDKNLGIGSGSHGRMTGEMLIAIEEELLQQKSDVVLVYGDTNTTLAGTLAASKLHIPVAHVESGLRSYFMKMPEEQNRIVSDHLSTFRFCPTENAVANLRKEGITHGVHNVGDVMYDAFIHYKDNPSGSLELDDTTDLPERFYLLTLHRAENTDDPVRLGSIVAALNEFADIPAVFPIHPRTRKRLRMFDIELAPHIRVIEPVGYLGMIELEKRSWFIVTDSGGVQKEAYFHKKPCITLRDQTEWKETVDAGWNTIVGADRENILQALQSVEIPASGNTLYGDGHAGEQILTILSNGDYDS